MKNLKSITAILFLSIVICSTTNAQSKVAEKNNDNFSVQYTGTEGDYVCFLVEINDATSNYKTFNINDKIEGELYVSSWEPNTNIQKFKIEKKEGQVLIFNLKAGKNVYTKTYSFSTEVLERSTAKVNDLVAL